MLSMLALALAVPALVSHAPPQTDAATTLRAGLSPEALAAAGVTAAEVTTVLSDLAECDAYTQGDLADADSAYATARANHDELRRIVKSGQATEDQVTELAAAKVTLASAEADVASALDALHTAGVATLSTAEKASLAQVRANSARRMATELLAVSRTDAEWIELNRALAHEKVCLDAGEELHATYATLLADARADTAVAQAKANLDSNFVAVNAAWDAATE